MKKIPGSVSVGAPVIHHFVVERKSRLSLHWEVLVIITEVKLMLSPVLRPAFSSLEALVKTNVPSVLWLVVPLANSLLSSLDVSLSDFKIIIQSFSSGDWVLNDWTINLLSLFPQSVVD